MSVQSARQAASAHPGVVLLAQRGYQFGDAIEIVIDRSGLNSGSQCGEEVFMPKVSRGKKTKSPGINNRRAG